MRRANWKRPVASWLVCAAAIVMILGTIAGMSGWLGPNGPGAVLGLATLLGGAGLILDYVGETE